MKTDRQQKALIIIFEYWKEHHSYPSNIEVAKLLDISPNIWGNIRRAMIQNGKLVNSILWDFELSSDILQKFVFNDKKLNEISIQSPVIKASIQSPSINKQPQKEPIKNTLSRKQSVEIPILGQVVAGTDRGPDDLIVDLSPSGETLLLPDIDDGQEIYVLEVQGRSMESDSILPNDYVIVERISSINLKNNDLIVAKYLKDEFNSVNEDEFNYAIKNSDNFKGPTLKYYNQIPVVVEKNKKGEKIEEIRYQLAPKNKDSRYTIITRYIDPDNVGRVVSIHRTIRRL